MSLKWGAHYKLRIFLLLFPSLLITLLNWYLLSNFDSANLARFKLQYPKYKKENPDQPGQLIAVAFFSIFLGVGVWSCKAYKINKRAIENGGDGLSIISGMTRMVKRNHRFGKQVAERYQNTIIPRISNPILINN
jgi:hypothetical protein